MIHLRKNKRENREMNFSTRIEAKGVAGIMVKVDDENQPGKPQKRKDKA